LQYVLEFADAVETAVIGDIVGPVQSEFGYHVIQVRARENREVEENELEGVRQRDFEAWLKDLRTAEGSTFETFNIWTDNVPNLPTFTFKPF
jgi:parvulin-like peptidyl-prolyl isomerase